MASGTMVDIRAIRPSLASAKKVEAKANRLVKWLLTTKVGATVSIVVMMGVAAATSLLLFAHQSLRLDESQSLWQVSHSPAQMLTLIGQDVHVPLYHLILHLWVVVFGDSVSGVRLLSLLFFLATIPAVYLLARQLFRRPASLLAAGLLSLSPFMIWYATEARMYTLLTLLTVLNQLFFMRLIKGHNGLTWVAYALTAMAGIVTHYFFGFVLLTQAVYYVLNFRRFGRWALLKFMAVAVLVASVIVPWLLFVRSLGSASGTQPLLTKPTTVDLFNTFSQFLFGFQDDHLNTFIVALWPLAILIGFLLLRRGRISNPAVQYVFLAAIVPVVGAFIISITIHPFYLSRYLIVALPAVYLLLIWALAHVPRFVAVPVAVSLVIAMATTLGIQGVSAANPLKEDYREASTYLEQNAGPTDVVVLSAPFTIYPVEYYYEGQAQLQTLPVWDRFKAGTPPAFSEERLPADVKQIAAEHEMAWVLLSYDQGGEKAIKDYFDTHYELKETKQFSKDLTLYSYRLRYDIPDTAALIDSLNK